ncbi:MAG: CoA ester lyase [Casimicrobiaceae bacterium]
MALALTYLFVPGDRPDRFDKAAAAGADAVILDLEDAVAPEAKDRAREAIGDWLTRHAEDFSRIVVRINDIHSPWWTDDLALLSRTGVMLAMLPKAESAAQVDTVAAALHDDGCVIPLIETARGVQEVEEVANAKGVLRLAFGTLDYTVDLDIAGDERALLYPASRIVIASRCAGIVAPVAGVTPTLDDDEQLRSDLAFERALGFRAKLLIHPRQVAVVRDALLPSAAELAWARKVLAAAAADGAQGAVQVDGRMVDRPVIRKAQAILARALR